MSSVVVQPTKGRFRSFQIAGVNMLQHIHNLKVFETIKKPYLTAKAHLIDNTGLIKELNLKGADCSGAFDAGFGKVYDFKFKILIVKGQESTESLRTMHYDLEMIGEEYFKDKAEQVQKSFKGVTGTQAIQMLHQQFFGQGLKIIADSLGPISQQSYNISSDKPFKAINDIRKRLNYGQFKSGNTLYFKNAEGHVLAPLEGLMSQLSPVATYVQKATWGANWFDMTLAENAIISALTDVDEKDGSMSEIASAAVQEKKVFDLRLKKVITQKLASQIPIGKIAGDAARLLNQLPLSNAGGHGGKSNYHVMDSDRLNKATDPSSKSEEEQIYKAVIKSGPNIIVKVPIQSGLLATVGKGVNLQLIPPAGDFDTHGRSRAGGLMLVVDLCHELWNTDKLVQGTTTMKCVKGGYD